MAGSGFASPVAMLVLIGVAWSTPVHDDAPQIAAVAALVNVTFMFAVVTSGATRYQTSVRTLPVTLVAASPEDVKASPLYVGGVTIRRSLCCP